MAEPAAAFLTRPPIVVDCSVLRDALALYAQQEIEFHHPEVQTKYALAVRHGLSAYDAAYLWIADLLKAPLATFDAKLAREHLAGR